MSNYKRKKRIADILAYALIVPASYFGYKFQERMQQKDNDPEDAKKSELVVGVPDNAPENKPKTKVIADNVKEPQKPVSKTAHAAPYAFDREYQSIGWLSARWESAGSGGPAAVSSDYYFGSHQMAAMHVRNFLDFAKDKKAYNNIYKSLNPEDKKKEDIVMHSAAFKARWKETAAKCPNFETAQEEFFLSYFCTEKFAALKKSLEKDASLPSEMRKLDFEAIDPAIIAAYVSVVTQHTDFSGLIKNSLKGIKNVDEINSVGYIKKLYDCRIAQAGDYKTRYKGECKDAVKMFNNKSSISPETIYEINIILGKTRYTVGEQKDQANKNKGFRTEVDERVNTYKVNRQNAVNQSTLAYARMRQGGSRG